MARVGAWYRVLKRHRHFIVVDDTESYNEYFNVLGVRFNMVPWPKLRSTIDDNVSSRLVLSARDIERCHLDRTQGVSSPLCNTITRLINFATGSEVALTSPCYHRKERNLDSLSQKSKRKVPGLLVDPVLHIGQPRRTT